MRSCSGAERLWRSRRLLWKSSGATIKRCSRSSSARSPSTNARWRSFTALTRWSVCAGRRKRSFDGWVPAQRRRPTVAEVRRARMLRLGRSRGWMRRRAPHRHRGRVETPPGSRSGTPVGARAPPPASRNSAPTRRWRPRRWCQLHRQRWRARPLWEALRAALTARRHLRQICRLELRLQLLSRRPRPPSSPRRLPSSPGPVGAPAGNPPPRRVAALVQAAPAATMSPPLRRAPPRQRRQRVALRPLPPQRGRRHQGGWRE
mmetsp:Transcript_145298/g.378016  ORF Transcript_145298/g.378016 Transcript_145298/m.378016 type:complete len:261 (+) Transcript_145298:474-1256(+)